MDAGVCDHCELMNKIGFLDTCEYESFASTYTLRGARTVRTADKALCVHMCASFVYVCIQRLKVVPTFISHLP